MEDRKTGWTGKRLIVDLSAQRSWTEEIPEDDLKNYIGGRGLNAKFFLDRMASGMTADSTENPIAFGVGPLAGTFAPCTGWTAISILSPISCPSKCGHAGLPGHWGPQLKFAGFDQLVIRGKAEKPVFLAIEGEEVRFEDAKHLRGKDTLETTVAIQDERKDRNTEVLCIGPAGENLVFFSNVTNRFSWTGDHIGMGYAFGSKKLKAIAVHGNLPVTLRNPASFLQLCLDLRERIRLTPDAVRLKEEGPFLLLKEKGPGFGIKNYSELSQADRAESWRATYLTNYLYGKEGCFSCPIHCGRISEVEGNYFGGVHFESAWSLGPQIAIEDWGKTLWLLRICQLQGLDPSSVGSLLSWLMDCYEKGILSSQDLGPVPCDWGDEKAALQWIERIVEKREVGEILSRGSFLAAKSLGKGVEQVPHFWGMDFPARDPRSSPDYALSRALFPMEWDYLQSLYPSRSIYSGSVDLSEDGGTLKKVSGQEKLRVLADLNSLCPLVVARLPLVSASDIEGLFSAATGSEKGDEILTAAVMKTMEAEKILWQKSVSERTGPDPLPLRFFKDREEKGRLESEIAKYRASKKLDDV